MCRRLCLVLMAAFVAPTLCAGGDGIARAVLFVSPTCPHCRTVREQVLPKLGARFGDKLRLLIVGTNTRPGYELYLAACQSFGLDHRGVPLVVIGDSTMMGSDQIAERFPVLIESRLAQAGSDWPEIPGLKETLAAEAPALLEKGSPVEVAAVSPAPASAMPPASQGAPGIPMPDSSGTPSLESATDADAPSTPPAALAESAESAMATAGAAVASPTTTPSVPAHPAEALAPSVAAPAAAAAEPAAPGATTRPLEKDTLTVLPGTDDPVGLIGRVAADPYGNSLAILVLVGMIATLVRSLLAWRRPSARSLPLPIGWLYPLLALAGLGVALYLAHVEVRQIEAICGPVGDCNTVQQSPYARLFGLLPIGVLGAVGFVAILVAWATRRFAANPLRDWAAIALLAMTGFGTAFSVYLTFLEPFVIGATCLWCLSSSVIMTLLFVLSLDPGRRALAALSWSVSPQPKEQA